ncbi:hypothetical protein BOCO_0038 [Bombiscardovia coagulans]|uniref:Uncharacterized protein n=1 Tax=Bombiscardovia coagulans TaxID=686666 RepID=A0A261EVH2_9BIFI|nr:hypothetical protein BOCO_0038 [Bombiscardovia coagulans]
MKVANPIGHIDKLTYPFQLVSVSIRNVLVSAVFQLLLATVKGS